MSPTRRRSAPVAQPTSRVIDLPLEPGEQAPPPPAPTENATLRAARMVQGMRQTPAPAAGSRRADDSRRPRPYVWVSWLTGLLAETDACLWRTWYRAHFRYAKRPDPRGFDLATWKRDHDAMTAARVDELLRDEWAVSVEEDNAFRFEGKAATLAGKPDVVALKRDECLTVDEKSGEPKPSDAWQVRVYMFVLPLVQRALRGGYQFRGEVEYRGHREPVPPPTIDQRDRITSLMRIVGGQAEPPRVPSGRECAFCDVLACPDRITSTTSVAETDLF